MQVIDAFWERRNLGVTCTEVVVNPADRFEEVQNAMADLPAGYQVVKAPVARLDLCDHLRAQGFTFVEASISVEHDLRVPPLPPIVQRMIDATTVREVVDGEAEAVFAQVHLGLFNTDRVFIDPAFTPEVAANRYVNWIRDELDGGGVLYELQRGEEALGFFVFRDRAAAVGASVLSGLYDGQTAPGMGVVLLHAILDRARIRGMKRLSSRISTNNVAVVKTHALLGFSISEIQYVFVRHAGEGTGMNG